MKTDESTATCCSIRERRVPHQRLRELLEPVEARIERDLRVREPFHFFRYLDEQVFRYNHWKANDGQRFDLPVRNVVGSG